MTATLPTRLECTRCSRRPQYEIPDRCQQVRRIVTPKHRIECYRPNSVRRSGPGSRLYCLPIQFSEHPVKVAVPQSILVVIWWIEPAPAAFGESIKVERRNAGIRVMIVIRVVNDMADYRV